MGGQEHGNEVAELIWKDRFYGKLLASWIAVRSSSFCSLTFVDAFVNAVNQMAGKTNRSNQVKNCFGIESGISDTHYEDTSSSRAPSFRVC